ncbi:DUF805 domain-containing protein [Sulfitobacter sp. F26169L]|uniref:DUF805 domain-containing protein n=1 Tax=Sulfitobacter sp. F26169L TaxID=2996015 RepID=UPI002260BC80|nr:DUF805 domain-containing protein [Sulfitobacter sp. F26169L]MCX7566898.1 DUF805 domain-containing protein [Sulfitobacter sp. F26169L]
MTGPLTALNLAFVNFFTFKGRATRAEFWWVSLFFGVIMVAAIFGDFITLTRLATMNIDVATANIGPFDFYLTYYVLITTIPYTTLSVRRLHDVGMSGFWWLLNFVPFIGSIALLVIYCLPSNNSPSIHGTSKIPTADTLGKPLTVDAHKRAMQGYAVLFDKDKPVTKEMQAARKAEIADYYRSRVLNSAPSA